MPSTTRGSILISTANDIGEAIVEKLGGVGYSPNEWKDKLNLCGIAPIDSAPALSVLADSAGTGDERGSILLATADAIGAILNKKYNVLRGFKPKEWASACRKMKALEEGNVASASIASFSDGGDTVPLTSCVCTIDANIGGKSSVVCTKTGKNLVPLTGSAVTGDLTITPQSNGTVLVNGSKTTQTVYTTGSFIAPKNISFKYSGCTGGSASTYSVNVKIGNSFGADVYNGSSTTFTATKGTTVSFVIDVRANATLDNVVFSPMIRLSTDGETFEPYDSENKTADLGRVIYGGSADIITGDGVDGYTRINMNELSWDYDNTTYAYGYFYTSNVSGKATNKNFVCNLFTNNGNIRGALNDGEIGVYNNTTGIRRFCVRIDSITTVAAFEEYIASGKITYELETPTDFTFEPVKIDSFPGVNNIWNDCGDTAVEYYQAPTPYTRKTATGGVANFSDQRTDLPLTKAIANIAPSIAGKSAVNLVRAGKNLADGTNFTRGLPSTTIGASIDTITESTRYAYIGISAKGANYTISSVSNDADYFSNILIFGYTNGVLSVYTNTAVNASKTVDFSACDYIRLAIGTRSASYQVPTDLTEYGTIQLEVGSSASAYVPYQAPTTYTADLGETVYGGSVDFVSGEVNKEYGMITFDGSSDESWLYSDAYGWFYIDNQFGEAYRNNSESDFMICNLGTQSSYAVVTSLPDLHFACTSGTNSRFAFKNSQYSTVEDFKTWLSNNNMIVVYKLATPTESAIPGRVISPIDGVNNYWNDAGGDTEIQYFEDET